MSRIILSLFDHSGEWSKPYREAGYEVRQYDLAYGEDVRLLELPQERIHGILAAPPCTVFSAAGSRWKRQDSEMLEGLSCVDATLRIVYACEPRWWVMENPVGKLTRYIGPPQLTFQPYEYGDPYTKRTSLWGQFAVPEQTPVTPTEGSMTNKLPDSKDRAQKRSITPAGFARAFFKANP